MNRRTKFGTLALVALGSVVMSAPSFAWKTNQQNPSEQPTSNHSRPSDSAQSNSVPATTPSTNTTAEAKPDQIVVPAGTHLPLVLHNGISTRDAQAGTQVYLETTFPVVVNDRIVIPVGSYAQGEITEAKRPSKGKGGAEIRMRLTTIILPNGYTVKLDGVPTNADNGNGAYASKEGGQINQDRDKGADAGTVITTTGAGAGIGAIASGARGAGIGAGIGAATGLAAVMMTRGPELELPRGSTLDVVLDRPVYLDASKINFTEPGRATALPAPPPRQPSRTRLPF
ncbi:MAG TPA: hypothetical protein VFB23_06185 [Candidatus Acidoferrales bacterium]|nr:hypothetical protein [Candidatus Acidoferrales bacterium]